MLGGSQEPQTPQVPKAEIAQAVREDQAAQSSQARKRVSLARLNAIRLNEQRQFSLQVLPIVNMTVEDHELTAQRLIMIGRDIVKIGKLLITWYSITQDDERARAFFRMVSDYPSWPLCYLPQACRTLTRIRSDFASWSSLLMAKALRPLRLNSASSGQRLFSTAR